MDESICKDDIYKKQNKEYDNIKDINDINENTEISLNLNYDDYYDEYRKYKKIAIVCINKNNLLKEQLDKLKMENNELKRNKESMKKVIHTMNNKIKEQGSKINIMNNKLEIVRKNKNRYKEQTDTNENYQKKYEEAISKLKELYHTIRNVFLSCIKTDNNLEIDDIICRNIENEGVYIMINHIDKMLNLIINRKNKKIYYIMYYKE